MKDVEAKYGKELGELKKAEVMSKTLIEQLKETQKGLKEELDKKKE